MPTVLTGLEVALRDGLSLPGQGRVALLCNNAVTDAALRPTVDRVHAWPHRERSGAPSLTLDRLFSPQHGFDGEKQDNMIESADGMHRRTGLPILSLYGDVRKPPPASLDGLDAVLIDLPDVGTRVYTFLSTAVYMLRAAAERGLPVIVLDRPNPIGDVSEGPLLDPAFESFVGVLPVPLRHGLTIGEYCRFAKECERLDLDLSVVPMEGYRAASYFDETGLPWVLPSPNMPTLDTAVVYPGGVALEGVNLSEGRGTTRPFELWGAPWIDPRSVRLEIERESAAARLTGFALREAAFEPTFHKFRGETVQGFQVHIEDRRAFRSVSAWVAFFVAVRRVHPDLFAWRRPPYEYEHEREPIDLIFGTDLVRRQIDGGASTAEIVAAWEEPLRRFDERTHASRLYA